MPEVKVTVENKAGLHARPAALIAEAAQKFECDVFLSLNGMKVNAKSILEIMLLAAEKGSEILIIASGGEEDRAVKTIKELFDKKFGEE